MPPRGYQYPPILSQRGFISSGEPLADTDRHVLVEAAVIAEGAEEQLQAFALDDRLGGRIVDHQMRKVGLAGHRAKRRELRRREADEVQRAGPRIGHIVEHRLLRGGRQRRWLAEVGRLHGAAD